jgi:hypothetical protein
VRQVGAFNGKPLVMAAAEATLTRVLDDAADARVEAVKGCPLAGLDDVSARHRIRRLEQLSRRMRVHATATATDRQPPPAAPSAADVRTPRPGGWRSACPHRAGRAGSAPRPPASRSSTAAAGSRSTPTSGRRRRARCTTAWVVRDAYLLSGRQPPSRSTGAGR